jgi:hypothetical protein
VSFGSGMSYMGLAFGGRSVPRSVMGSTRQSFYIIGYREKRSHNNRPWIPSQETTVLAELGGLRIN